MSETTGDLIARIEELTTPSNTKASDENSDGAEYVNEIFMLEAPEGGDISEIRAVGFSGWEGTLKNEPTQPVRFYVKVIAFEDDNAPHRNWQKPTPKITVVDGHNARELYKKLETLL